ncbi:hypothetical protein BD770DRAFT_400965, partial [Pilaira anomala]
VLWLYVQIQRRKKKLGYLKITRSGKIPVPYAIHSNYLSFDLWKFFWSLSLCLTRWSPFATLFRWNSQLWSSSLCQICKSESETIQHFFVSCFHKWTFWEFQLTALQLTTKFPTPESVWLSIYTLHDESGEFIDEAILLSLGTILEIIWRHHWMCIFDNTSWSNVIADSLYNHSLSHYLTTAATSHELIDIS